MLNFFSPNEKCILIVNKEKIYTDLVSIKHILSFRFDYFLASKEIREIFHFPLFSDRSKLKPVLPAALFLESILLGKIKK